MTLTIVNMIPKSLSGEEHQDSEPTIAVNTVANNNRVRVIDLSPKFVGVLLMATPMAKSAAKAHANRLEPIIVCGDPPM